MTRTLIQYDNGTTEWLTDSEAGVATLPDGHRGFMPKQALCASVGWYTVVRSENAAS